MENLGRNGEKPTWTLTLPRDGPFSASEMPWKKERITAVADGASLRFTADGEYGVLRVMLSAAPRDKFVRITLDVGPNRRFLGGESQRERRGSG